MISLGQVKSHSSQEQTGLGCRSAPPCLYLTMPGAVGRTLQPPLLSGLTSGASVSWEEASEALNVRSMSWMCLRGCLRGVGWGASVS